MFFLICFDIVDDRVRYRTVKILGEFAVRVQKSVFEAAGLSEKQFLTMCERIEDCIDNTSDTVRYYRICKDCLKKMEFSGIGESPMVKTFRVV